MELIKHSIQEVPPFDVQLLVLVHPIMEDNDDNLEWVTGVWTSEGWILDNDLEFYEVYEWYELPFRSRQINDDFSYRQMKLEEFFDYK